VKHLPKVELHMHLEGAAPPGFIRGLAAEKGVDLSSIFDEAGHYDYQGFTEFLRTYEAATSVLTSPEDYARLTTAVLEESASSNVVYTESFISPDFCGGRDLGAWREYTAAIREAGNRSEAAGGPSLRCIVTCVRHFGPEKARESARCAAETAGDWVTGFGMGGDELMGTPADFAYAFDMAREAGLGITSHAGEWGGAAEVARTLDVLRPSRIGHGIQAADDPALCERLAENGIVLEVCPGSNVALGAVPGWAAHPIEMLRRRGVTVTISTDDPPFFHTTMNREYERLADTFGYDEGEFMKIARASADAAFCDDATRSAIHDKLKD
jgi:adenosine deaminase